MAASVAGTAAKVLSLNAANIDYVLAVLRLGLPPYVVQTTVDMPAASAIALKELVSPPAVGTGNLVLVDWTLGALQAASAQRSVTFYEEFPTPSASVNLVGWVAFPGTATSFATAKLVNAMVTDPLKSLWIKTQGGANFDHCLFFKWAVLNITR